MQIFFINTNANNLKPTATTVPDPANRKPLKGLFVDRRSEG
jgi:hypothetical protein